MTEPIGNDDRIVGHLGMSGSGKTYALQRVVERSKERFIVLDRLREWAGALRVDHAVCDERTLEKALESDVRVLLYTIDRLRWTGKVGSGDRYVEHAARLADVALDRGLILVTPEVHRVAPVGTNLPEPLDELAGAFRHWGAGWYYDSQRPALVHLRVREQTQTMRIFAVAGSRDRRVLAEDYGTEMLDAIDEASARLSRGESGWHVSVDPRHRAPPYKLERFRSK